MIGPAPSHTHPADNELGHLEEAQRVINSLIEAVDRFGAREYYNPLTGRGLAAHGLRFSTPLVDLLPQCGIDGPAPSAVPRMMAP